VSLCLHQTLDLLRNPWRFAREFQAETIGVVLSGLPWRACAHKGRESGGILRPGVGIPAEGLVASRGVRWRSTGN